MIDVGGCSHTPVSVCHTPVSVSVILKGDIKAIVNLKFSEMSNNERDVGVYADNY